MKKANSILLLVAAFVAVLNLSGPAMGDVGVAGSWVAGTSHTAEAGNDRVLVFIAHGSTNSMSLTDYNLVSVTYGGQAMTKVMEANYTEDSFFGKAYAAAFILNEAGIAAATSSTFVPTWKSTPSATKYASVFLKDTYQTSLIGDKGSNGAATTTITTISPLNTSSNDMVILAATDSNVAAYTLNNGFTEGIDQNGTNITGVTGHKPATGAPETPSATFSAGTKRQVIIGFVVQAVPDTNKAAFPSPADGEANVSPTVVLRWAPGIGATSYDVYLGTDPNAHNNSKVTVDTNSYSPPSQLNYGTKYYWAVDCNQSGTIYSGNIWHFSTVRRVDPNYTIANWYGFRTSATSYTFDAEYSGQFKYAIPMFNDPNFGFHGTFEIDTSPTYFTVYPTPGWAVVWPELRDAASHGHEITANTITHPYLTSLSPDEQRYEISGSIAAVEANVPGTTCDTFAIPYCAPADDSILAEYFIAARNCTGSMETNNPSNFYRINSKVCGSASSDLNTPADFNAMFEQTDTTGGWNVFLIHCFEDDSGSGYSPLQSSTFKSSLQYLAARRDRFWVETFGNVVRYIKERNDTTIVESSHQDANIVLQVSGTLKDSIYNYPVTIRRPLPTGWPFAYVSQNGQPVDACVVTVNSVKCVMFDAVPNGGPVVLLKGLYGDFTEKGMVDYNDLSVLHNLWLVSDCNQTASIDLGGDCIINFQEFAALAENWLKTP